MGSLFLAEGVSLGDLRYEGKIWCRVAAEVEKTDGFGANKNHQTATKRIQAVAEVGSDNEILEFAIAREMEAYQLYMTLAERAAGPQMRTVFEDLAKEELDHKEKLELEVMKTGQTVPATPKFNIHEHEYILSDNQLQSDMDYKDMLLLGIKKEEASFRTYIDLIPQVQNQESREVLLALAEEEVKHKLRFEIEYDLSLKKGIR